MLSTLFKITTPSTLQDMTRLGRQLSRPAFVCHRDDTHFCPSHSTHCPALLDSKYVCGNVCADQASEYLRLLHLISSCRARECISSYTRAWCLQESTQMGGSTSKSRWEPSKGDHSFHDIICIWHHVYGTVFVRSCLINQHFARGCLVWCNVS